MLTWNGTHEEKNGESFENEKSVNNGESFRNGEFFMKGKSFQNGESFNPPPTIMIPTISQEVNQNSPMFLTVGQKTGLFLKHLNLRLILN